MNLNPRNESDRTPLHVAALYGFAEVIRLLINAPASTDMKARSYINAEDEFSQTPLHLAAENGNKECVVELLKQGANINNM